MASRRSLLLTAAALIASTTALQLPSSPASAASYTMTVVSPIAGRIGIDAVYPDGVGDAQYDVRTCTAGNEPTLGWNSAGQLVGTSSVPSYIPGRGSLQKARFEMYPGPCGHYTNWGEVGGVHIEAPPSGGHLGTVKMPVAGQGGAFKIHGDVISRTPITDGRVRISAFQVATAWPDAPAPLQTNGYVDYGAFAVGGNQGDRWSAGVGWPGQYVMFVTDQTNNRGIQVFAHITPSTIPTIDLDATCFGFDLCTQKFGSLPPVRGEFYPTNPTRILDTRTGLGITGGPVKTGDGRNSDPHPVKRRAVGTAHELKVTGKFGIPDAGVSAVLLNVTAVDAPGDGFLSLTPKPPRTGNIFDDQAGFDDLPNTSNINVDGRDATPNMVLARVGAGGKIRIYNSNGPTHVIADVAGWFGTDGRHNDGAGFEGVVPERLMDSRTGLGGPQRRFGAWETRYLKVAGVAGVPANAESVVVNITTDAPSAVGNYITAYPKGQPMPEASNVNGRVNRARSNMAVVKVGADGHIAITSAVASANVIVDVFGSFGPYGKAVTSVSPVRSVDTRSGAGTAKIKLRAGETRTVQLAGRTGVPAYATAVVVNILSAESNSGGYFTAFPSDADLPSVSNVNFNTHQNVPNLAMLKLGPDGADQGLQRPGDRPSRHRRHGLHELSRRVGDVGVVIAADQGAHIVLEPRRRVGA